MARKVWLSICNADANPEVLVDNEDEMEVIVKCPYCGRPTKVGDTLMISGYVGCPACYWGDDGLASTVMRLRDEDYGSYVNGEWYKKHREERE